MESRYLNKNQMSALIRYGDILIPGMDSLPSFSKSGVYSEVDRMFEFMTDEDRDGMLFLLSAFYYLPTFVLRFLFYTIFKLTGASGVCRLLEVGLKGVIFTLYYSNVDEGGKIFKTLNYAASVNALNNEVEEKLSMEKVMSDAKAGQVAINQLSVEARVKFIIKLKQVVLQNKEEIITAIQKETNKSKSDIIMSEIFSVLDHLDFLIKASKKGLADRTVTTPMALMGKKSLVSFEALGVSLIISPWNYPFFQAIVPITLSFVCGNSVIYKPSEFTPMKGLIENWAQVVYGDGKLGEELINLRPAKIFFTGSVGTGKKIMQQAGKHLIPVELELGGKDPMVVFEDVDLLRAAKGAAWGAFTNLGQACTSVERVYVHEKIYDDFKKALLTETASVLQGVDSDGSTDVGLMITTAQRDKVINLLRDAKSKGAKFLTGDNFENYKDKMNLPLVVLENVNESMLLEQEEIFGPVLPLYSFKTEDEAVERCNDSDFGLSASVWSNDNARAMRVAKKIQTGNVSINNVMLTEGNSYLPFGGVKNSGIGRFRGEFGFYAFTNIKSIIVDKNSKKIEANWYPYTKEKYQIFSKMVDALFADGIVALVKFLINGLKLEMYCGKIKKRD